MSTAEAAAKHAELVALWRTAGPEAVRSSIAELTRVDLELLLTLHTGAAAQINHAVR